jgi:hypothetical protein
MAVCLALLLVAVHSKQASINGNLEVDGSVCMDRVETSELRVDD